MANLIDTYYETVETSNLNATHLTNQFRTIFNELEGKMKASEDHSGLALLSLEKKCLDLDKSIEKGLQPQMTWSDKDENGKHIEYAYPNHQEFGLQELNYLQKRHNETLNLFLKTEYGLLLLLKGELNRNDEKQRLSEQLIRLVEFYWTEALDKPDLWSRYMYIAFTRLMDAFLILKRSGAELEEKFNELVELIQTRFLEYPYSVESYFQLSTFLVNTFCEYSKSIKTKINAIKILTKLEDTISYLESHNTQRIINVSKLILKFCATFQLAPKKSYLELIAKVYESFGDKDVVEERWIQATKNFEDSLNYFDKAKNREAIKRLRLKIGEHKGKFPMASIPIEGLSGTANKINVALEKIVEEGDISKIILAICGYGVYPKSEILIEHSTINAKARTLLNMMTIQSQDKFGNTSRIYKTEDEKITHHLFIMMNVTSQRGIQIIGHLLKTAIYREVLAVEHIEEILTDSWMSKEIELIRTGNPYKIKTLDAVLPSVKTFLNELTTAIKTPNYQPEFICCTDSMVVKIEYILRNLCRSLKKPTFKFWFEDETMLAEEKSMSGLLIELEDFLRKDDILWIRFLLNEKGGYNLRNRVCHGLLDSNEYGYSNALHAFSIIIRLSLYKIEE